MRILVPIKNIIDPAGLTVNRKAGKVFVNREGYLMNPASKCALEAALRVEGAEVIALSFGGQASQDCLREARALGAHRAIFIPAQAIDSSTVVRTLVPLIAHLGGIDLISNGHITLDTGLSTGAWMAEALGWPYLGEAVDCTITDTTARIVRKETNGIYQAYEADLPAVVTITRDGPQPRYAHGGHILVAYRDPNAFETITLGDLGLGEIEAQPTTVERGQSFPPEREFGKQVSVAELATLIR
jgi:electron transfer flavoprotein beta subunit